jgi:pimeloyl-ACP methyl ester carboxylesterase
MKSAAILMFGLGMLCGLDLYAQQGTSKLATVIQPVQYRDPVPLRTIMVPVEQGVSLEVLDFGGKGRPVVLLAGLGDTAHVFDSFAPLLVERMHVYGVTRRGFGDSSHPADGYDVARLGKDVVAVLDSLKVEKAILVGHSIAGEELSWIANNDPARVAGLVYLEAGYPYAYFNASAEDFSRDEAALEAKLKTLATSSNNELKTKTIEQVLQTDLPRIEHELHQQEDELKLPPRAPAAPMTADKVSVAAFQTWISKLAGAPMPLGEVHAIVHINPDGSVGEKRASAAIYPLILQGGQQFTRIPLPLLAIYACPHNTGTVGKENPETVALRMKLDSDGCGPQAEALRKNGPDTHVILWPNTDHALFLVRPQDVRREIYSFIDTLHQ